jgi:transposase InsO family protein
VVGILEMERIYYDAGKPGSFSGARKLSMYSGNSLRTTREFLSLQPAYTLHAPARRRFPRRETFSKGINDLFQADIADMSNISRFNDGHRYLLTCIDVFSKFAWVVALKSKSGIEVTRAFEENILSDRKCRMLQTDKGLEFLNRTFQDMLKKHGIHFYTSENDDIKAAVVERFNRTLKERLYRFFTYKNTGRYLDVLEEIVRSYNRINHRSIGMAPIEVNSGNEATVADRLYPDKPKTVKWALSVGDAVRISVKRTVFRKGYVGNWSEEIFSVSQRFPTQPVTYGIVDAASEPIKGRFYQWELQKVGKPTDDHYYVVEKILKTRKRGGSVQYFVKWRGYPDSMNSWTDDVRRK